MKDLGEQRRKRTANESNGKLSCWEITTLFLSFLLDDPTRGETATRCQSLQEVACELTLLRTGCILHCLLIAVAYSLATQRQLSVRQPCTAFCVTSMPPLL